MRVQRIEEHQFVDGCTESDDNATPRLVGDNSKVTASAVCNESIASLKSARSTASAAPLKHKSLFSRLPPRVEILCTNALCIFIFLAYAFFGGCVLLYLEYDNEEETRRDALYERFSCVANTLKESRVDFATIAVNAPKRHELAHDVAIRCLVSGALSDAAQREWNLKSAFLFGFGLLTTLGYGKVTPFTTSSRMFAVAWGLLGVPFAVIILSNLGLYLRFVERFLRKHIRKCSGSSTTTTELDGGAGIHTMPNSDRSTMGRDVADPSVVGGKHSASSRVSVLSKRSEDVALSRSTVTAINSIKSEWNVLPISLALFVLLHLTLGAIFLPLLNTSIFDFINGFYYCYICFTGMEYGALVNHENSYFPIVLIYNCVGLAMSTIVLNVSSTYAKKLYYCSRRVGDFAQAKIWIGSKHLRVKELLSALSQTIGVDPDAFQQLDLDQMIEDAILVKEGRLACVPQAYTFLEGIWPPELVPLFLRDGSLPDYVDADDSMISGGKSINTRSGLDSTNSKKPIQGVKRDASQLTVEETNALKAAIALSTFANGCLHRTLCPTAPAPALKTTDDLLSPITANTSNETKQAEKQQKKRQVSQCVKV